MPSLNPGQRVFHIDHVDWGLGEVVSSDGESTFRVFFEWVGDRFRIGHHQLFPIPNTASSEILDMWRAVRTLPATDSVYVIELAALVYSEPRYQHENPEYRGAHPCVYVGSTGRTPQERFADHMSGRHPGRFVRQHGLRLMPGLCDDLNPRPQDLARTTERAFAAKLRQAGYAVWQR
jgi:hypothetical protein